MECFLGAQLRESAQLPCCMHPTPTAVPLKQGALLLLQAENASSDATLCPATLEDPEVQELRGQLEVCLQRALEAPAALQESFSEYQALLQQEPEAYAQAWVSEQHSLEETEQEIERLLQVGAGGSVQLWYLAGCRLFPALVWHVA